MYFEIQYTIADIRSLIGQDIYDKKVIPQLESLQNENNIDKNNLKFLRSVGASKSRRKTSYIPLEGESFRLIANRAFRFPTFIKHLLELNGIILMRENSPGVYRGFFRNTFGVVNRFQWGFNFKIMNLETIDILTKGIIFNKLIDGILEIPGKILPQKDIQKSCNFPILLKQIIKNCTIRIKHKNAFEDYLLVTDTVIIFQLKSFELKYVDLPYNVEKIKEYNNIGVNLYKYTYTKVKENLEFTIYFIVTDNNQNQTAQDEIRMLRICLFRFFAEKECLLKVLQNDKHLNIDRIKYYLNAPIHNKYEIKMLSKFGLNDNNCNYILSPNDRAYIYNKGNKILNTNTGSIFKIFT